MKFFPLFLVLLFSSDILAFQLNPMSATIDLGENKKSFNFVIENESNQPLPVQISLFQRQVKENGEDVLLETNELSAFPDQLIIPAEQKRSVKVTWTGNEKEVKVEKAFRFVAEQLPLNLKKGEEKSGVKMLLKYVASLYVTPKGSKSDVSCSYSELQLRCENRGNKHQLLFFKSLSLADNKTTIKFSEDDLKKLNGENTLALSKRDFNLSFKKEIKNLKTPVKVNYKFE